jgi:hypothetical protein
MDGACGGTAFGEGVSPLRSGSRTRGCGIADILQPDRAS